MVRRTRVVIKVLVLQKPLISLTPSGSALVLKSCLEGSRPLGSGKHEVENGTEVIALRTLYPPTQGPGLGSRILSLWFEVKLHFQPFSQKASAEPNYVECQPSPFTGSFRVHENIPVQCQERDS